MSTEDIRNEHLKRNKMPQRERYESQYNARREREIYKEQVQERVFRHLQTPKIDEVWYLKVRDAVGVSKMRIKDLTEYTVLLRDADKEYLHTEGTRYTLNDIMFIEKV